MELNGTREKKILQIDDELNRIENRERGFAGTLKNIQLPDLIQMCCLSSISINVKVVNEDLEGLVCIRDGEIVHAELADGVGGEEALYAILHRETGSFETVNSMISPDRTINKSWQSLLMEAVRRIDEKNALSEIETQEALETGEDEVAEIVGSDRRADGKVGVLIVEDSAIMFNALEEMLSRDGAVEVLGRASNGAEAVEMVDELKPDLITLDVNMPVMDGGTALKHIMIKNPCPVVIVSSIGKNSRNNILDFLRLGAVDYMGKPARGEDIVAYRKLLAEMIKSASAARIENFKRVKSHKPINGRKIAETLKSECEKLVVIGSGSGGYAELMRLIPELPGILNCSIVVFQKMAPELLLPLSDYLNRISPSQVVPLDLGEFPGKRMTLAGGWCYVSDGRTPVRLAPEEKSFCLEKESGPAKDAGHFDRFLMSVAKNFPGKIQVVLLSGSKIESAAAIGAVREKGGRIMAQAPESSLTPLSLEKIVYQGLADMTVAPTRIADQILLEP